MDDGTDMALVNTAFHLPFPVPFLEVFQILRQLEGVRLIVDLMVKDGIFHEQLYLTFVGLTQVI